MRYDRYEDAYDAAQIQASTHRLDVVIRKTKEYGKTGYNVSFAARNDSDYALAEIVTPNCPKVTRAKGLL